MTNISALTNTVQTGTVTTNASSQTLSADMNTFLTLLTTQLKYQDPLDPMDTAEFTNQLVQYSSVEQAIQTNSKLDTLLALNVSNLGAQAVSYIGKTAQVMGDVMPLENGVAKATYTLNKEVASTTIMIKDMSGKVVYTTDGNISSGTHEFTWDGKDTNGIQLKDGAYQIIVSPKVNGGEASATVTTTVFGRVSGVASDDNNVYIGLGDAVTASLSDILTMRDDDYFNKNTGSGNAGDVDNSQNENVDTEDKITQTV
ncbi:MAG: flagellar hook assembly protein FlgD [Alphaproteobacteria bacterium]|nr:flagellar hook assembly protein FlgD [Alphaproteobacteria bacterium]